MKVLVVDDDVELLDLLHYALRREGFTVLGAVDGQQALQRWEDERPDLILLDVKLPKMDGFEVCRRIREESATPIIMLTARDEEEDVVRGLRIGADDYVAKPFSAKQLIARMQAVLRRTQTSQLRQPERTVRFGSFTLDVESQEVLKGGESIPFTRLEFLVLYMLALNMGRVVPYSRLIEYAWGYYEQGNSNLLKTHVSHIRQKLGMPPSGKTGIVAVTGVGYKLVLQGD